jgi:hypothetical protein
VRHEIATKGNEKGPSVCVFIGIGIGIGIGSVDETKHYCGEI